MDEIKNHKVSIENREKTVVSGVKDVESFDENEVVVDTELGLLTLTGENFKLNKLVVDTGELVVWGTVDEINYSIKGNKEKEGFLTKLFKILKPGDAFGFSEFRLYYVFAIGNMYSFKFCSCEFDDNIIHTICISYFVDK